MAAAAHHVSTLGTKKEQLRCQFPDEENKGIVLSKHQVDGADTTYEVSLFLRETTPTLCLQLGPFHTQEEKAFADRMVQAHTQHSSSDYAAVASLFKKRVGEKGAPFEKLYLEIAGLDREGALTKNKYMTISHDITAISDQQAKERATLLKKRFTNSIREEDRNEEESKAKIQRAHSFIDECLESLYFRFYLVNGGLNGALTEYMTLYHEMYKEKGLDPWDRPISPLEKWYFEQVPLILAYQENHRLCRETLQTSIGRSDGKYRLASLACGTLYEFMTLTPPEEGSLALYGYDTDPDSILLASANAKKHQRSVTLKKQDAWQPMEEAPFDLITCNGFSFYIGDNERLQKLFKQFYDHLNPGGKAIVSFILPKEMWHVEEAEATVMEKLYLMMEVIPSKWTAAFRSYEEMRSIGESAQFSEVSFLTERWNIHPSIVMTK